MTRKLKALGVAMFGVFALSSIAAQAATAEVQHSFTAEATPAIITAVADPTATLQKFTPDGASIAVECNFLHADGTQTESPADQVSVIPTYENCNKILGITPTITNPGSTQLNNSSEGTKGGCKYVFDSDTTANSNTAGVEDAPVTIECEKGAAIIITIPGICVIRVTGGVLNGNVNENLHGVKYNNVQTLPGKKEITLEAKVHKVAYTSSGSFCATGGVKAAGTAIYEGKATVAAYNDQGAGKVRGTQINTEMTTP